MNEIINPDTLVKKLRVNGVRVDRKKFKSAASKTLENYSKNNSYNSTYWEFKQKFLSVINLNKTINLDLFPYNSSKYSLDYFFQGMPAIHPLDRGDRDILISGDTKIRFNPRIKVVKPTISYAIYDTGVFGEDYDMTLEEYALSDKFELIPQKMAERDLLTQLCINLLIERSKFGCDKSAHKLINLYLYPDKKGLTMIDKVSRAFYNYVNSQGTSINLRALDDIKEAANQILNTIIRGDRLRIQSLLQYYPGTSKITNLNSRDAENALIDAELYKQFANQALDYIASQTLDKITKEKDVKNKLLLKYDLDFFIPDYRDSLNNPNIIFECDSRFNKWCFVPRIGTNLTFYLFGNRKTGKWSSKETSKRGVIWLRLQDWWKYRGKEKSYDTFYNDQLLNDFQNSISVKNNEKPIIDQNKMMSVLEKSARELIAKYNIPQKKIPLVLAALSEKNSIFQNEHKRLTKEEIVFRNKCIIDAGFSLKTYRRFLKKYF